MKNVLLIASTLLVACTATSEPRDWSFVQSVGGISVGEPAQSNGVWLLPVEADVSGLREVTTKPTAMNSGIACHSVAATIEGQSIFLVVSTTVAGQGRMAQCPSAALGQLRAGAYSVLYRGPNEAAIYLRQVSIG